MKNGRRASELDDPPPLDGVDRQIVAALIADGRIALAELGRRINLSPPATAERVRRLELAGVITGYHAQVDLRALGYPLTAIVRVRPATGQLRKIAELAISIPQVSECHRITGEDCFYMKLHLRSIEELPGVLDRFLLYGQTTTSIINGSPIPGRTPPPASDSRPQDTRPAAGPQAGRRTSSSTGLDY